MSGGAGGGTLGAMMVAVVGGGPAGLRAAEVAAEAGTAVTVFDAKASVGRKFLVAGGGGLNLTKAEPAAEFARRYRGPGMPAEFWPERIAAFGPEALRAWAAGLGVETFVQTTGRVYPREMKAAPLLRAWVRRLRGLGVRFAMHHRLVGLHGRKLTFATPEGEREIHADAVILALGGGSWPETGSDGGWVETLRAAGVAVSDLAPANCGWEVAWPAEVVAAAEGQPLKNVAARAGRESARGELLVTRYGLEGGAVYALGAALRAAERPELRVDFKPDVDAAALVRRFGAAPRGVLGPALAAEAERRWRLGAAAGAIVRAYSPEDADVATLAARVKDCGIPLAGPRPLAEAISSAGGVRWSEVDEHLMLRALPGVFVAGEMIDWEAPTGGYLMQGCFATGGLAGERCMRGARMYGG